MKVFWTPRAKSGLEKLLFYFEENWSSREIYKFKERLYSVLNLIKSQPELFPQSEIYMGSRKALIDKYNYVIFRVNMEKSRIEILVLRGTRQRPVI